MMITLYQLKPQFGLPNACPFCMKVETFLRMSDLDYKSVPIDSIEQSVQGGLPYLDIDNKKDVDSRTAIEHIEDIYCIDLDAPLTTQDRQTTEKLMQLLERDYYWALLYSRWLDQSNWPTTYKALFSDLPWLVRKYKANQTRKAVVKMIQQQERGVLHSVELYRLGCQDLKMVVDLLADKQFMMGEQATKIDATVYPFLANTLYAPIESPLQQYALQHENLEAYCRRMYSRYFA